MRITQEQAESIFKELDEIIQKVNSKYPIPLEKLEIYNASKGNFEFFKKLEQVQYSLIIQNLQKILIAHLQSIDTEWKPKPFKPVQKKEDPMLRLKAIINDFFGDAPTPENTETITPVEGNLTSTSLTEPDNPDTTETADTPPALEPASTSDTDQSIGDLQHLTNPHANGNGRRPRNSSKRNLSKPRSVTTREAVIGEGQDQIEQAPPFSDSIKAKVTELQQAITTSNGINPGDDVLNKKDFPADVVLIPLIKQFKRIKRENAAIIEQIQSHIATAFYSPEERDNLENTHIPKTITHLLRNNVLLETLQEQIQERREVLNPKTNDLNELQTLRKQVWNVLTHNFRQVILNFIQVKTVKSLSNEPLHYVKAMEDFVGTIEYFLCDKSLPVDKDAAEKLCKALIDHLGQGTYFNIINSAQKCIDHELAVSLIAAVFPDLQIIPEETDWLLRPVDLAPKYKSQIADAHILLEKIKAFSLEDIVEHNLQQTKMLNLYDKLQSMFSIDANIDDDATILSRLTALHQGSTDTDLAEAKQLIEKLPKTKEALQAHEEQFGHIKNVFKETDIDSLKKHIEDLENLDFTIEKTKTEILNTHTRMGELALLLDKKLEAEKKKNIDLLNTSIINARAVYMYAEVNIEEIIEPANNLRTKIQQNLNIPISQDVQTTCDFLDKHTVETMKRVTAKLQQRMNTAIAKIKSPLEISSNNPFREDYEKVYGEVQTAKNALTNLFSEHKKLQGQKLLTWINEPFEERIKALNAEIADCECKERNVKILEARLENPVYKTSLGALLVLSVEFKNLINTEFPNTPNEDRTTLRERLETVLTMEDEELGKPENNDLYQSIMGSVKLSAIWSLYAQFVRINSDYINKSLFLLNDEQYRANLINQLGTTLTNLEQLPKEKSGFGNWLYQFFKPLLDLFCCCFAEQENPSNSRFHKSKTSDETYSKLLTLGQELEELKITKVETQDSGTQPSKPAYDPTLFAERVARRSMSMRQPPKVPQLPTSQP